MRARVHGLCLRVRILAAIVAALLPRAATAQAPPTSHVSISNQALLSTDSAAQLIDGIIADLDPSRLRLADPTSWEGQIVHSAERAAARSITFALADSNLDGSYTIQRPAGDILIARWKNGGPDHPDTVVWLWDSPSETIFLAELATLQREPVAEFVEGLFQWKKFIGISAVKLQFGTASRCPIALGSTTIEQTQFDIYWVHVFARPAQNRAILGVRISKVAFTSDYPAEAVLVPERFPPLRDRITGSSRLELFAELEKDFQSTSPVYYPRARTQVLDRELLRRGELSDAEVEKITLREFTNRAARKWVWTEDLIPSYRLNAFLSAAADLGQLPRYEHAVTGLIDLVPPTTAEVMTSQLAARILDAMRNAGVNSSQPAFALIEKRRFVRTALFHLSRLSPTEELIDRLSSIDVPPELAREQLRTIANMKRRLAPSSKHSQ